MNQPRYYTYESIISARTIFPRAFVALTAPLLLSLLRLCCSLFGAFVALSFERALRLCCSQKREQQRRHPFCEGGKPPQNGLFIVLLCSKSPRLISLLGSKWHCKDQLSHGSSANCMTHTCGFTHSYVRYMCDKMNVCFEIFHSLCKL